MNNPFFSLVNSEQIQNNQIIIDYNDSTDGKKVVWNFNADVEDDVMGECFWSSIWMKNLYRSKK